MYEIVILLVLMAIVTVIAGSYYLNKELSQASSVSAPILATALVSAPVPTPVSTPVPAPVSVPGPKQILPADLRPFKDLVYGIHKNYINSITNNYNKLILTVFSILNKTQIKQITMQNLPIIQTEVTVNKDILELVNQVKSEYPIDIGQTLLKHFLKASIFQLLDNSHLLSQ